MTNYLFSSCLVQTWQCGSKPHVWYTNTYHHHDNREGELNQKDQCNHTSWLSINVIAIQGLLVLFWSFRAQQKSHFTCWSLKRDSSTGVSVVFWHNHHQYHQWKWENWYLMAEHPLLLSVTSCVKNFFSLIFIHEFQFEFWWRFSKDSN